MMTTRIGFALATMFTLLQITAAGAGPAGARVPATATPEQRALSAYGKLPLAFVANRGQFDAPVRFNAQAAGASFSFTRTGAVFAFARGDEGVALALSFVGANRSPLIEGAGVRPGRVSYLLGNHPAKWRTGLRSYRELVYRDVWPGIDVAFRGGDSRVKYEFRLEPGADVSDIRLRYRGAERLSLAQTGDLGIHTALGVLRDTEPVTYQVVDGARVPVESRYTLAADRRGYGFSVGAYDRAHPLVIDPGLVYSTLLGGSGSDIGRAIAADSEGNAYVTGLTTAPNFPTTVGAFDVAHNGSGDVFVTKLNANGSALVYSTFLGGALSDDANGIAVDASGQAVVTGRTDSSNFPTSAGAHDPSHNGSTDGFVTKLSADGTGLVYSTYIGGSGVDWGNGIALDSAGNAYVAGQTESASFPTTPGVLDTTLGGGGDAFVAKLDPAGTVLFSTFLGGASGGEVANALAVDFAGNAYLTGFAGLGFPTTAGAFDTSYNGGGDAYVAKLNPVGSALVYSTYLGTGGDDHGLGIAVDLDGNAYVTGRTNASTFPITAGAFDTTYNGGLNDAYVTKLNADGSALVYSTFLGGSGIDWGRAIAVDAVGNAYVAGLTDSSNFPTTAGAFDTTFNGGFDAYVTVLRPDGSGLAYSTFLGGEGTDQANGIAVAPGGDAYVTGSTDFTFPTTAGAFDTSGNGGIDAWIAKLATAAPNQPPTVDSGLDASINEGETFASSGSFSDPDSSSWTATVDYGDGSGVQSLALNGNTFALSHLYDDDGIYTITVSVTDNQGASGSDTTVVTVGNVAPAATFAAGSPIVEGNSSALSLSDPADASADTAAGFRYSFACDGLDASLASTYAAAGTNASSSCVFADDGTYTVKGRIFDKDDGAATYAAAVVVQNAPPEVGPILAPTAPVPVGTTVNASAPFTDPGVLDTHTAVVEWGDGTSSNEMVAVHAGSGTASGSHVYATPGVYTVTLTVTDDDGGSDAELYQYVVVYDPNGPSVRGRGAIISPAGGYVADPSLTGEAVFGFSSDYRRGATIPSGHTRFRFRLADFTFVSRDYDWLVVAGARAQFKGTGEVNGSGSFGFLLTAVDGDLPGGGGVDRFRIKIWDKATGKVVYDNGLGAADDVEPQALTDGSITIG